MDWRVSGNCRCWLRAAAGLVADGCALLPRAASCCYYPNEPHREALFPVPGSRFPLARLRFPLPAFPTMYRLIGPDGSEYQSPTKGTLGGHRRSRIYGRLDCPGALRALARGGPYATHRVFFADEATAVKAGYRPCWLCCRPQYIVWKRGLRAGDGEVR